MPSPGVRSPVATTAAWWWLCPGIRYHDDDSVYALAADPPCVVSPPVNPDCVPPTCKDQWVLARVLPCVSSDALLVLAYVRAASSDSGVWLDGKLALLCAFAVLALTISKGGGVPGAVPGPRLRHTLPG